MTKLKISLPIIVEGRYDKSTLSGFIEGTVINSILSRGVKVEKGAVVKNCVLFKGTRVEKNATLNCIVTDKDVTVTEGVNLSGNENMPFYIQKSRKI